MRRILFVAVGWLAFSGCWNKNFQEPGKVEVESRATEQVFNASYTRTWAAIQAAVAKFPIQKKDSDAATGRAYITTDWIRGKSDVLYHGFDETRVPYVIRYKLSIYVTGSTGHTKVVIKNLEQYLDDVITAGVDFQGGVQTWIKTESSTWKENAFLLQIDKLLRDPKFKPDNF